MRFSKMHGAGNDYVFVDGREVEGRGGAATDWAALAARVSDRHFGVGSDGLIVAVASDVADVRMRMWNADGSESEMCGNGIRCFAKFVLERDAPPGAAREALRVETGAGVLTVEPSWDDAGRVAYAKVDMGEPTLRASDVPVDAAQLGASDYARLDRGLLSALGVGAEDVVFDAAVTGAGERFAVTAVGTGNPHAVAFIEAPVAEVALERIGPAIEHHAAFPNRVNFHVANLKGRGRIAMRPWERGAGLTLACATGAAATVVAARLHGFVDDRVAVELPGGEVVVTWEGRGSMLMEGAVQEVFTGELAE